MLHNPCGRYIYNNIYAIIMGWVFHETFVSFITFKVYMFKILTCFVGKRNR